MGGVATVEVVVYCFLQTRLERILALVLLPGFDFALGEEFGLHGLPDSALDRFLEVLEIDGGGCHSICWQRAHLQRPPLF